MYKLTKLLTGALALASVVTFGQETKKSPLTISGSVDAYYQTYLTAPDNTPNSFGTSFTQEAGFSLGMGNAIFSYEGAKTGAVLDAALGPKAQQAVGGYAINQLYAYWNVSEKTTLTIGRFNTHLGYEVISPTGNFNYSTSYLFSSGPFSHVGLKADFALSDDFSLMLAVMNPTNGNIELGGEYTFGAQLGYKGQYLNFIYDSGIDLGFEVDYTGGFDVSDEFFLGINAAYQDIEGEGFHGVALYPQYATSESFSIGLRGEYFGYHGEADDQSSVFATTLTGSYTVENLTIKPEVRLDAWSNNDGIYIDNDGAAAESLAAFTLGAIYSF